MTEFISVWHAVGSDGPRINFLTRRSSFSLSLGPNASDLEGLKEILLVKAAHVLSDALKGEFGCLLLLEKSLPSEWLQFDWENLLYCGQPLSSRAVVVRRANPSFLRSIQVRTTCARWLNLFPANEHDFQSELSSAVEKGKLRPCYSHSTAHCIEATSDLFVLAHGDTQGLVDQVGNAFQLTDFHSLPDRIWLLACNSSGVMHGLAQQLLERGVRTVVVATSDLSAPQIAPIIEDYLSVKNVDPASWLATSRANFRQEGGVRSLAVWGEVCLDDSASAMWNSITWDVKHDLAPHIPLDDETPREEYTAAIKVLDAIETWPTTRNWMRVPLLWLAEKFDHAAMRALAAQVGDQVSPRANHALAIVARRVGNYPQMARYLSRGFALPEIPLVERSENLGALANLFIDLDLPETARSIIQVQEDLHLANRADQAMTEFKQLDMMARVEARQGRPHIALDLITAKRNRGESDGGRELAWQLYLASWGNFCQVTPETQLNVFAQEAMQRIQGVTPSEIYQGNETAAYLLRALSAFAWSTKDAEAARMLVPWLSEAESRLATDDPGPWAYLCAYLYFSGRASDVVFERAVAALVRAKYHLEAAAFLRISGDLAWKRHLLRFQHRRRETLKQLDAAVLGLVAESRDETVERADRENNLSADLATLALSGLLPL